MMLKILHPSKLLFSLLCILSLLPQVVQAKPAEEDVLHILIPSGKGGGWDTTARAVGEILNTSHLIHQIEYENFTGAGGGRALIDLVRNEAKHSHTLMVQSTPLILRNLTGAIGYGFRDISPIAILLSDYQVIAVPKKSPFKDINALFAAIKTSPAKHPILGGSASGSLDHVTLSLAANALGIPMKTVRYIPTEGGGNAMELLNRGVGVALVSGLGEVVPAYQQGEISILGVTSLKRLESLPELPTFIEQGVNVEFSNWRGFFANAHMSAEDKARYLDMLAQVSKSPEWARKCLVNHWQPLFITGDELNQFLNDQESLLQKALIDLDIK